ncbi:MAG: LuxR family transcriptional regulator [Oscillatoriales cyanobacterium RU_3_3]|nr:LuxR family transcriptional regulator [Oscillatoriales cyanobacterium RU_3_3]
MVNSLYSLFDAIARARDDREIRLRLMDAVGEHFGVQRWGIYLFGKQGEIPQMDIRGVPNVNAFVDCYETVGREVDPVLRYVLEFHAPAHEAMVLSPGGWKQCELYKRCCASYEHEHIITGPIVGGGRLIGTINLARVGDNPAFGAAEVANLSALCLHLSASLAALGGRAIEFNSALAKRLTPRELQIAQLVARGLTNAEIGGELWIAQNSVKQALKRMFRKLNVGSRVEMVAQLQGILGPDKHSSIGGTWIHL